MSFSRERSSRIRTSIFRMVEYQVISKVILAVVTLVLSGLARILLASTGREAITSGDFGFLFTSWQGWLILIIGLIVLMVYFAFDLSGLVIVADECIHPAGKGVWRMTGEAFKSLRRFATPAGVLVTLFVAILCPILGLSMTVSVTSNLVVPNFIESVIMAKPLTAVPYTIAIIVLVVVALLHLFTIHHVVIGCEKPAAAMRMSRREVRGNRRTLVKRYALHIRNLIIAIAVVIAVHLLLSSLPLLIANGVGAGETATRYLLLLFTVLGNVWAVAGTIIVACSFMLEVTVAYHDVVDGGDGEPEIQGTARKARWVPVALAVVVAAVVIGCYPLAANFDEFFPAESGVQVIAHRGGGNLGPENTVMGLERAASLGCLGSEIDVQRTADGHYVINHDGDFKRVAGDSRKPEEMTLDDVRQLRVEQTLPDGTVATAPVATLEEMLDASKGKIMLYIELKGATADEQMADDVVAMVLERDMVDEVEIISLDYKLMDYVSTTYPEFKTGLLFFFAFGETAGLNVDDLILEELPATVPVIGGAHLVGKTATVWTVNTDESIHRFLTSPCDAVITDNADKVLEAKQELAGRSDYQRIQDVLNWTLY